jgi:hypothetical protein
MLFHSSVSALLFLHYYFCTVHHDIMLMKIILKEIFEEEPVSKFYHVGAVGCNHAILISTA